MTQLTGTGKALVVTLFFRLLFGGYLIGLDQYGYNDVESALTVLVIYGLLGVFAALFLFGKRYGLKGIIGLDIIFIALQSVFIIATLGQIADAGLHSPLNNQWTAILMYSFSLLTIGLAIKTYKEK